MFDDHLKGWVSSIHIRSIFPSSDYFDPNEERYKAVWDTGASRTFIPSVVVEHNNLEPTGRKDIIFADGRSKSYPVYCVSMNVCGIYIPCIQVVCLPNAATTLIGLDIIDRCDIRIKYGEYFSVETKQDILIFG